MVVHVFDSVFGKVFTTTSGKLLTELIKMNEMYKNAGYICLDSYYDMLERLDRDGRLKQSRPLIASIGKYGYKIDISNENEDFDGVIQIKVKIAKIRDVNVRPYIMIGIGNF